MASRNRSELEQLQDNTSRARGISALSTLMRGRKHVRPSTIPGSDVAFVWRVLGGTAKQECLARAVVRFEELGIPQELRLHTDLEDELTWQLVAAGMRNPEVKGTDVDPFPEQLDSVDNVRECLTVDERDILISEYMDLEEVVDPDPAKMPELWHGDIMAALKKSLHDKVEGASILSNFGSRSLISFLLFTVAPQLDSLTGKSTSSLGDTTNPTESEPAKSEEN